MTGVLDPLLARHASWLSLPDAATADVADESPDQARAMPVVLRIERAAPPARTEVLEAAASAAVAVCLDERSAPGGQWHEQVRAWVEGRIRKVARRARGSHWSAVENLPGCTVRRGAAQVRALLPYPLAETPKEVSRLQISGSELAPDEPGTAEADRPVLWLNPDGGMTAGKAAAQVGHATMLLAAFLQGCGEGVTAWREAGFPCAVRTPDPDTWRALDPGADVKAAWYEHGIVAVRDAGFTEVDPGTVTVLAQWTRECARRFTG